MAKELNIDINVSKAQARALADVDKKLDVVDFHDRLNEKLDREVMRADAEMEAADSRKSERDILTGIDVLMQRVAWELSERMDMVLIDGATRVVGPLLSALRELEEARENLQRAFK